jgi:hypothetical protein
MERTPSERMPMWALQVGENGLRWALIRWRHFCMGNNDGQEGNAESSVDEGRGAYA